MSWIESHQSLKENPKTYKFIEALKISKAQGIGHLHLFWWWCVDYAQSGILKHDIGAISRAAEWKGNQDSFFKALLSAGFIDKRRGKYSVHDWSEFRLHFDQFLERKERQREQVKERVKAYRERKRNGNGAVTQCNADKNINNIKEPKEPTNKIINESEPMILPDIPTDQEDNTVKRILEEIDSPHSEGFYRKAIRQIGDGLVLECLGEIRQRLNEGKPIENPAAYFTTLLKERMGE